MRTCSHNLLFADPTVPGVGGIFLTVRQGGAWGRYGQRVDVGDSLLLVSTKPMLLGRAELLARFEGKLQDVPESWVAREHAAEARTRGGLLRTLRSIYGEFEDDYSVTALLLLVLPT